MLYIVTINSYEISILEVSSSKKEQCILTLFYSLEIVFLKILLKIDKSVLNIMLCNDSLASVIVENSMVK